MQFDQNRGLKARTAASRIPESGSPDPRILATRKSGARTREPRTVQPRTRKVRKIRRVRSTESVQKRPWTRGHYRPSKINVGKNGKIAKSGKTGKTGKTGKIVKIAKSGKTGKFGKISKSGKKCENCEIIVLSVYGMLLFFLANQI
jgi:hypothetical protein